jgi:hypothetical protein
MHRWRSGHIPFELIDYIFERADEDSRITIAPPHVFELLHYLDNLATNLDKYKDYKAFIHDYRVKQFVEYLEKAGTKPILSEELMKRYRIMGRFRPLLLFADARGYRMLIREPLQRFLRLVDEGIMQPFSAAIETEEVPVNKEIYDLLFRQLELVRDKHINNQVDALTGAIVYEICSKYYTKNEFYSTVITHSPRPFKVLNEYTRFESDPFGKMPLVRRPLYLMARRLCKEKYGNARECAFALGRIVPMLWHLYKAANIDSLYEVLKTQLTKEYEKSPYWFRAKEFRELHSFTKMFFYDINWESYFKNSIAKLMENDIVQNRLIDAIDSHNKELITQLSDSPLTDIAIMRTRLENLESYHDSICRAQEQIRNDVKNLYMKVKDFVGDLDSGVFSAEMIDFFRKLES